MAQEQGSDVRLIERWLPIAEIGAESLRERTPMTPFPAPNRLHVWWARRPLVASRAAIMASLLPSSASHDKFMQILGILGDPVASRKKIARSKRTGVRFDGDAYSYERAFTYCPTASDVAWFRNEVGTNDIRLLDPTAGGGSIPLESRRLGIETFANDLNPVAALILSATVDLPIKFGDALVEEIEAVSADFVRRRDTAMKPYFPVEPDAASIATNFLWARTLSCPYCAGLIPLSPNWRLTPSGKGVRLRPVLAPADSGERVCEFEIVENLEEQSHGTIAGGDATCPFPDCGRVVDGDQVKAAGRDGSLGEQLFAIVYKKRVIKKTKNGRNRQSWERGYRAPVSSDEVNGVLAGTLREKLPEWRALDVAPTETYDDMFADRSKIYGVRLWTDLFSARQLIGHCTSVEIFREFVERDRAAGVMTDLRRAAYIYLGFSLDRLLNYNSRMSVWMPTREVTANTFNRHDFAFCWSHAEMNVLTEQAGYDWAVEQTVQCVKELVALCRPSAGQGGPLFGARDGSAPESEVVISLKSGNAIDHIGDQSIDAVVIDPPYGANVMYAELADFFYVWLKRTAGLVAPELFTRRMTDKQSEAVANPELFAGRKGAAALATRDYQEKMASIFTESRRVLKAQGVMTVMFTHKDTSAWDALTKGLIEAGFIITASWPVNTEAEGSLHIKDKAAANSTIFLVCRPRPAEQGGETTYWEDVEPLVAKAVRTRVDEFQKAGISGVDLYLASFGPALEEFSRHWPLKRGTPRPEPLAKKRRKQAELFEEEFDPFAVTPEDALDAARREVKTWRLNQLTHTKGRGDLDATTSWFVLAWDAFKAPVFSYDEGLRLARAVGADLDGQLIGKICEKKGSDIKLWDSATRAAKNALGPADGSRAMIDAIHHAAHRGRTRTLEAAFDLLKDAGIDGDPQFLAALEAVLEVLPPSRNFVGFDVATGDAKSAADDFDALEKLRRLAFSDKVDEPQQLSLFTEEAA